MSLGLYGTGTVSVQNGGYVYCSTNVMGSQSAGNGTMIVDGVYNSTPSNWYEPYGLLTIGNAGIGTMKIANGGLITARTVTWADRAVHARHGHGHRQRHERHDPLDLDHPRRHPK